MRKRRSENGGPTVMSINRAARLALTLLLLLPAAVVSLPSGAIAATQSVTIRDNNFNPEEIRIDPGDSVLWTYANGRNTHRVQSDERGQYDSGDMRPGDTFEKRFTEEGYYPYFCRYHGGRNGAGMSGLIIVGDPPPPDDGGDKDPRRKLVVPRDFKTIQKAVDRAKPRTTILVRPGTYREAVVVQTDNITIKGVDRFRTILNGNDNKGTGITFDGVKKAKVANLTVRNYLGNGIYFNNVTGYTATRIDSIKNRTYGIYAFDSYDGVFKKSFGWGSGDSAFYVGQCLGCSALLENLNSQYNYLGYSGTNATGVVIRDSLFKNNGAGVVPNTLPTEELGPNRGTIVIDNKIVNNNYSTIPEAGFSETVGIPFGTGIWFPGTENNTAIHNVIRNHNSYGVLISQSIDESLPMNNMVVDNLIRNSDADEDGYGYDLAWDGTGASNCFSNNDIQGETGPPMIQDVYACANRPFPGTPFPPVQAHIAASATNVETRDQEEPPEPKRPRCQRGAPGCSL